MRTITKEAVPKLKVWLSGQPRNSMSCLAITGQFVNVSSNADSGKICDGTLFQWVFRDKYMVTSEVLTQGECVVNKKSNLTSHEVWEYR